MSDDATDAGLEAFDGNALASGNGVVRAGVGVAGPDNATPGFGMGVLGADGSTRRIELGTTLDGTTVPSALNLYDSSGIFRTGMQVSPSTNFVGFFTGIYTESGGSGSPLSFSGINESLVGNAYDNSASYAFLYDKSGNLRNGIEYFPSFNFNGFLSQDGSAHNLSLLGNALTTTSSAQANMSYMDLLDTTGTQRVLEFQNSTNEGGAAANPGGALGSGGVWGNP